MTSIKNGIKDIITKTSDAATNVDLKTKPVDRGETWCIQKVACEDETNAYTSLRILVGGHGWEHLLAEEKTPSAGTLYWTDEPFFLYPGEFLVARFTGTTNGDKLKVYYTGYKVEA